MKTLVLLGAALGILLSLDYNRREEHRPLRVPGADRLRHRRHDADDLGERPDLALSRARAAEPRALRRSPPSAAIPRSRPRPASSTSSSARCPPACCSTAPRWSTASPAHQLRVDRQEPGAARRRSGAAAAGDPFRHRLRRGRPRLQGLGRAVPHVDARRLRGRADPGDGLLRHGAQDRRHRAVRARDDRALRRPARRAVAADRVGGRGRCR
jgi:hypothetical protein